ncbi:MAG: AbrB/MazE/SpoVT family DNA-binding domain-containing protein [Pyrinomonadaceae bacterium]
MKVWSDFRVTIPAKIRRQLGMHPGTEVECVIDGDEVFLKRFAKHRRKKREAKTDSALPDTLK